MVQIEDIVTAIIREQGQIIGVQLASFQATSSGAIRYDTSNASKIIVTQEGPVAIQNLIDSYKGIFGQSSVEVCLSVLRDMPYSEISQYLPDSIRDRIRPNAANTKQSK